MCPSRKQKHAHVLIQRGVTPSCYDTTLGWRYTASSLLIHFQAHKVQSLCFFRSSDVIWVGAPCFRSLLHAVSARTCSECRQQYWSMKTARESFTPGHAWCAPYGLGCWATSISRHYLFLVHNVSCWTPPVPPQIPPIPHLSYLPYTALNVWQ